MSLLARKLMFKEYDIVATGPQLQAVEFQGQSAVVTWKEVADGLVSFLCNRQARFKAPTIF